VEQRQRKGRGKKSSSTEVNVVVSGFGEKQLTHGSVKVLRRGKAATRMLKSSCTEFRNRSEKVCPRIGGANKMGKRESCGLLENRQMTSGSVGRWTPSVIRALGASAELRMMGTAGAFCSKHALGG
jgi:hypothetical protein